MNNNNCLNEVFLSFDSLNKELSPGFHLVDTFSDHFSFHSANRKNTNAKTIYCNKLDNIYKNSLINQDIVLIILDASVKNNIATSVLYIHKGQDIIAKTVHYTMNIMSTKAELFTIRCGINCTTQIQDVAHIIIITDAIPAAKHIFNIFIHLYQLHSIAISNDLKGFFSINSSNLILFWNCLSSNKWFSHLLVDKS